MRKQHEKMPLKKRSAMKPWRHNEVHSTDGSSRGNENSPSLSYIPKRNLHFILHYLALQLIKKNQQSSSSSFSQLRHNYFLFQYYKNFQLKNRLNGSHFRC